jgi:1,4-alpha-glucan branching enzyme
MELGQWNEWNVWGDLEWHLLQFDEHQKFKYFFGQLNNLYKSEPALYTWDFGGGQGGFEWIDCSDNRHSVVSFIRWAKEYEDFAIVVCNFTPQPHSHYRVGVPFKGFYKEIFNSDAREFGGSNMGNLGGKWTEDWACQNRPYSIDLCLPPLGVLVLKLDQAKTEEVFGKVSDRPTELPEAEG